MTAGENKATTDSTDGTDKKNFGVSPAVRSVASVVVFPGGIVDAAWAAPGEKPPPK